MIRGTKRPMAPTAAQTLDFRASIHNRFDIEVRDSATGALKRKAQAFNVICSALWSKLLHTTAAGDWQPQQYFKFILFGSGAGTPAASDTALFDLLGAKEVGSDDVDFSDYLDGVVSARREITLQAEEYVGETLTEVGIGYDATHCVTHAMLEDMNGNPISIEKTDADVIKIYATVFLHFPANQFYGSSVQLIPGPVDSANNNLFSALFGFSTSQASTWEFRCVPDRSAICNYNTYVNPVRKNAAASLADKTVAFTVRLPAGSYNTPIRYMLIFSYYGSYAPERALNLGLGAWYTPPAITGEAVGTGDGSKTVFRTAFPIRTLSQVKVNGAAASGVTFRSGAPNGEDAMLFANTVRPNPEKYANGEPVLDAVISPSVQNRAELILENPYYSAGLKTLDLGVSSGIGAWKVDASADLATWETVADDLTNARREITIPAALKSRRFFRISSKGGTSGVIYFYGAVVDAADPSGNIVFATPPTAGAVITCDYVPDCIAKDENHVFDLTLELTLSEYSEG